MVKIRKNSGSSTSKRKRESKRDSYSPKHRKAPSVVNLNQMAEGQLPSRSTSQMESMVKLGGSFKNNTSHNSATNFF